MKITVSIPSITATAGDEGTLRVEIPEINVEGAIHSDVAAAALDAIRNLGVMLKSIADEHGLKVNVRTGKVPAGKTKRALR